MNDTLVKNCKIVTEAGIFEGCIAIENGKVSALTSPGNAPMANIAIDAKGKYVIPGVIDPHVHISGPSHLMQSETESAACGGVTTVVSFWGSESLRKTFETDRVLIERNSLVDMALSLNISGEFGERQIAEIPGCARDFGVTSFKFQPVYRGKEAGVFGFTGPDCGLMFSGLEEVSKLVKEGYPGLVMVHSENFEIIDRFWDRVSHEGRADLQAWTDARPGFAEEEAMRSAIFLADVADAPLYIVHMTGCDHGSGVDFLSGIKAGRTKVIVETCPQYLTLTKDDVILGTLGKTNPPLRDKESLQRLWDGINKGVIDCIGSDHAPVPRQAKDKDIWSATPGLPGVETLLPVMLSEGVSKCRITLERLVELCCRNTAEALGLHPKKGSIRVGADADLVVVDMKKKTKVRSDSLHSSAGWTPYEGREITGWPVITMLRGNLIAEDGEPAAKPPIGKYLARGKVT